MKYPTIEQVNAADHAQLATWHRFLPSPGASAQKGNIAKYVEVEEREMQVLSLIAHRFQEAGGWTAELSKKVGLIPVE